MSVLVALAVLTAFPSLPGVGSAAAVPATPGHLLSSVTVANRAIAAAIVSLGGQNPAAAPVCAGPAACATSDLAPRPSAGANPVWSNLASKIPSAPSPRYLASVVYDPIDQYVVLFGGSGSGGPLSDTWTYSGGVWSQSGSGSSPGARYAAFSAWDAKDGYMVLFGGYDSSTGSVYNDTWTFVGGSWTQLNPTVFPAGRWRGAMAYDYADQYVVLYGGGDSTGTVVHSDTWEFLAGTWTDLTTSVTGKPGVLIRNEASADATDGYVVMFGGCTSTACNPTSSSTWTYKNLTWTKQTPTSVPGGRAYAGMTWDAATGTVLMFGGDNYATTSGYSDTWEYLGGNWTDLSSSLSTQPSVRAFEGLAYDALDGYAVLFGGQNPASTATWFNDTWAFGPSVIGRFTAAPAVIDLGQSVTLNATPFAYRNYVNISYSNLPPGCSSRNVTVLVCTPSAVGVYPSVTVTENDSSGSAAVHTVSVTVNPDPVITSYATSLSAVTAGTRVWFNVSAASGTPPYSYSYAGLPAGCSSLNNANLSCVPSTSASGSFTVQVTVIDAAAYRVYANQSLTVNARPSVVNFRATRATIDLGQAVGLFTNVTGGTSPLTYSYGGLPAGCASADVQPLVCSPAAVGGFTAFVNVSDAFGWSATAQTSVLVNADPSISDFAASPAAFDVGHATLFYLNATGGTGLLAYSYTGLPPGCNLGAAAGGSCTPTSNGTFVVTAHVTDSLGFIVTSSVTLTISNDPQIVSVTPNPLTVDVGQNFSLAVVYVGGTAPITFSYTGLPAGCSGVTTGAVSCRPRVAGTYSIVAFVTDAWKVAAQLGASVVVDPAPSVTSFSASSGTITVGDAVTLSAAVAGGSGVYTFVYSDLPAGCASRNASTVTCTPTATGTFNVSLQVYDSAGLSANATTEFTVAAAPAGGILGLSGSTGYLVIGAVVAVVLVAAVLVLLMRRRRGAPAPAAAPEETETS